MLKKIFGSKAFRIVFSLLLIYLAFKKVNLWNLVKELSMVPLWFVLVMIFYYFFNMFLGAVRWSLLLLPKPRFKDLMFFTKAVCLGSFYSLFFPTIVAGDLMKWLPLVKHYPQLSKTKILGSVLIDRVVGFTAFVPIGLLALLAGKYFHYQFPQMLLWFFLAMALGVTVFYIMVFTIDFNRIFGRFKFLGKILEIVDLLKNENKKRILLCFLLSFVAEPFWMMPMWLFSLIFGAGMSLLQTYIFVPIVSLILILPISIAGFGARENLFLFFLVPIGIASEKILLMSTFGGIIGVVTNMACGILLFLPDKDLKISKDLLEKNSG